MSWFDPKPDNRKLVFIHANCPDGLVAGWTMHKRHPTAEIVPLYYDQKPPEVKGRDVFVLDFSFRRDVMLKMKEEAKSLLLLDHHKSAQAELGDLDFCRFDMSRSGCAMTWDYCFPHKPRHWLIKYIQDYDLYVHKLPNTHEINAAITSYPPSFDTLDMLAEKKSKDLIADGKAILRSHEQLIHTIISNAREIEIAGYKVLSSNTGIFRTEVANELALCRPFGVAWHEVKDGNRIYSLRSDENGVDVSLIAKKYGGGGHARASSFKLKPGQSL